MLDAETCIVYSMPDVAVDPQGILGVGPRFLTFLNKISAFSHRNYERPQEPAFKRHFADENVILQRRFAMTVLHLVVASRCVYDNNISLRWICGKWHSHEGRNLSDIPMKAGSSLLGAFYRSVQVGKVLIPPI